VRDCECFVIQVVWGVQLQSLVPHSMLEEGAPLEVCCVKCDVFSDSVQCAGAIV